MATSADLLSVIWSWLKVRKTESEKFPVGQLVQFTMDFLDRDCEVAQGELGVIAKKERHNWGRQDIWWVHTRHGCTIPCNDMMIEEASCDNQK